MALHDLEAFATTSNIDMGQETVEDGTVKVRNRVFTDLVESEDSALAGVNKPDLNLDINPSDGSGTLWGTFELTPKAGGGTWAGEMTGGLKGGMVYASGVAQGTGDFAGQALHLDFQQVPAHPGTPPAEPAMAFFTMKGQRLVPEGS